MEKNMAQNRNSLRSIRMIKAAFLKILKDKNISKITVKEVSNLADLTRNTFYAHFVDIYAVNESVEDDIINRTIEFIDEAFADDFFGDSLKFFKSITMYVDSDRENIKSLLKNGTGLNFINKFSDKIINHVLNDIDSYKIKDKKKFGIFLKILFSGAVFIIEQYLNDKIAISSDDVANNLNDIYVNCCDLYLEK